MKIAVDGPLRDADGYSQATRGVITGLSRLGIEVGTEDNWHCRADWLEPEVEIALARGFSGADVGIRLSQPDSGFLAPGKLKICWSMWEFTEVPKAKYRYAEHKPIISWPEGMNRVDINFVPCEHSKRLWLEAGCIKPVYVIPFGFDPEIYHWQNREPGRPFTFIISGTLSGRKNPNMVLDVFRELFANKAEARLIMKAPAHLPLRYTDLPFNVEMYNENWTHGRFSEVYRECDVFVYPTQGEGFGLSLVEAMATGLPPIVTVWSAPLDYIDESVGWPLDYGIEYVGSDFCLDPKQEIYQQFGYAQPYTDHLKERMIYCFDNRDEVLMKGRRACSRVFERYTWEQIGKDILEILEGLR